MRSQFRLAAFVLAAVWFVAGSSAAWAVLDIVPLKKAAMPGVHVAVVEEADDMLHFTLSLDEKKLGFQVGSIHVGTFDFTADGTVLPVAHVMSGSWRHDGRLITRFVVRRSHAQTARIGLDTTSPIVYGGVRVTFSISDFVALDRKIKEPARPKSRPWYFYPKAEAPLAEKSKFRPVKRTARRG
jgi:hypothetical protein